MISPDQFAQMQEAAKSLLTVVFQYEKEFKRDILNSLRWKPEEYEVDRAHISGSVLRVEIKFEDSSTYPAFIELHKVIAWYYKMVKENKR